ncbi:MAG: ammonia-dependent NAD(+) synthetase [Bavariicoccus seileri]|uniref:ammonia-dependent NAD(+) synthetase n=1 Tax=Bavariicoccus seileri TaxID=549685 RepID=UPI0003B79CAC|nr:ammonia-dependent NAD(+) synthetase [Bavariicoccus seileri]
MREKQKEIIEALKVSASINPEKEVRRSVDFLKEYLLKHPFLKTFVLGISGGQDSSLSAKLANIAAAELREETGDESYQFIAVRLPYGNQADEEDAKRALSFIDPDVSLRVNIKPAVDATVQSIEETGTSVSDFNKGNIKARQRMITQYAIATANAGVVIGTDHAAESVTGFFTKFGDGGADILPLWRLDKRQGKALLKYLGAPADIYTKVPTADLEDDKPLIADEQALGVTYEAIDDYLEGKDVSDKDAQTIESWYDKTEHKRQLPITVYDDFWK